MRKKIMDKIDFVLPWVDGSDKVWLKKKNRYKSNSINDSISISNARFRDMGTLRYVLRSIEQYCPWYNKIYIITEGHYPKWLNINSDKIVLVTHEELYYAKTHLPTFNSSSIEMNLANIKGLSDKFVYFNDDLFIMEKVESSRFFVENKPVDFFSHAWIPRNKIYEKLRVQDPWINSINNNLRLINKAFNISSIKKNQLFHKTYSIKIKLSNFLYRYIYKKMIWMEHWHHPQPYLRSTLEEVHSNFETQMMICSSNKFRSNSDLTQYLYRYWHLARGEFYPFKYNDGLYVQLDTLEDFKKSVEQIESSNKIKFVCFNDSISMNEDTHQILKTKLISYLNEHFPNKATFEI